MSNNKSSIKGAMRQLLGRKSHQKMSTDDQTRNSRPEERVFHLRHVRNNGDKQQAPSETGNGSLFDGQPGLPTIADLPALPILRSPGGSIKSSGNGSVQGDANRRVSERTQFVATSRTGPPRVFTGVVGDTSKSTYRRCEDEPIRISGAIQSFGALIGLKYNDNGSLEVRVASENSRKVIGYGPEQLFALKSFLDILKAEVRDELLARIRYALSHVGTPQEETRLDVFKMILTFPYEPDLQLWCAIHLAPNADRLVLCEFEEYSQSLYLKDVGAPKFLPDRPFSSTSAEATPEEFKKSTTRQSKPLPAIEVVRRKENKDFSALDIFNAMTQAQKQISDCSSVAKLLDIVVGLISELTGFHRVMLYQFDSEKNGCVQAEMLNPLASTDIFRGLHYPSSDIPPQARELYKINRTRILHDREAETSRLVFKSETDFKDPIDLTHSYLRAMSPIHKKYLGNLGVRSSMSISIVINNDLWGLIACHGYGDLGIHVSLPIQELCRSIGDCASANIQRLSFQERIAARKLPALTANSSQNPANFITNSSSDLLKLVDADFACVSIEDKVRAIGRMEPYHEALAIMSYLQSCRFNSIRSSTNIKADFPGMSYPTGIKVLAGLLLIPLNVGEQNDFLVFFRKDQLRHVQWAGNPQDKQHKLGTEYLEPRTSFRRWVETISGSSTEWTQDQIDTAAILGLLYGRFIETWRLKSSSTANEAQAKSDRDPAYLEDIPTSSIIDESFNLNLTTLTLLNSLKKDAQRNGLHLSVSNDRLPAMVKGDRKGFEATLKYFVENDFRVSENVQVYINLLHAKEETSLVSFKIQDFGPGMSEEQLDVVFAEFEQAQAHEGRSAPYGKTDGTSNNDLTVVARYIKNMNGQVSVTSEVGKGTIFCMEIPFERAPPLADAPTKPRKFRTLFSPGNGSALRSVSSPPQTSMISPSLEKRKSNNEISKGNTFMNKELPISPVSPITISFDDEDGGYLSPQIDRTLHSRSIDHLNSSLSHTSMPSSHSDVDTSYTAPFQLNILVADGDATSLRMLDEKLSSFGHTVDIATDGQDAYDRFESYSHKFDAILMDLKMPRMDGFLATRMIRVLEREKRLQDPDARKRVPIIALSPMLEEETKFECIQCGFDAWISKPVDIRRLNQLLEGTQDSKARQVALHVPGQPKQGGWFLP